MSVKKLDVAVQHGKGLESFVDEERARQALFTRRNELLRLLIEASNTTTSFESDYSPESLKDLESWYFELWESQAFCAAGMGRGEFETAMAMYFCEVLVRNDVRFRWIVQEYAFEPGKYEIGVRKETLNIMANRYTDLFARADNKKHQSIWRAYQKYTK